MCLLFTSIAEVLLGSLSAEGPICGVKHVLRKWRTNLQLGLIHGSLYAGARSWRKCPEGAKPSCTLSCLLSVPPAYYFPDFFPILPDFTRTPRLFILKKITFFMNFSCCFLSLLVPFTSNFQGKIACFCMYFNFVLYDNLFLLFPLFLQSN